MCSRKPLLATFGIDDRGRIYLHIKVFKSQGANRPPRIFGEAVFRGGEAQLHCRECLRWYTVNIPISGAPNLVETPEPQEV